ncbi:MAG TPA: ABC transporter ATP-binding protein [Actinomycetota bacterium]|nr:ABC transporter ATP-binding protein [Actinomycetota bacterium]
MSAIEVAGLSVSYGAAPVVEGLDLEVPAGSWVALIGANGAGKTTVLRAVAGLVAFRGRVRVGDVDVAAAPRRTLARHIAYVPQRPVLPDGASVTDYVLMGRNPHIRYLATESRADVDAVAEALERLDLGPFADRDVAELSGGEAQRVVLARALAQAAPVLLLDEPTSELDIGHQQQVLELVDRLRRDVGLTVLSTMHDLTVAGQYAGRFVLLEAGRGVAAGAPEDVLRADLIRRYYGASVEVVANGGGIVVVPTRRASQEARP